MRPEAQKLTILEARSRHWTPKSSLREPPSHGKFENRLLGPTIYFQSLSFLNLGTTAIGKEQKGTTGFMTSLSPSPQTSPQTSSDSVLSQPFVCRYSLGIRP